MKNLLDAICDLAAWKNLDPAKRKWRSCTISKAMLAAEVVVRGDPYARFEAVTVALDGASRYRQSEGAGQHR